MTHQEITEVKDSIRHWIDNDRSLPLGSTEFFPMWILLNAFYNAMRHGGDEVGRVIEFGKTYNNFFPKLNRSSIISLIVPECIGKCKSENPPDKYVKAATQKLRMIFDINDHCALCREKKQESCKSVKDIKWINGEFAALMRILYQVRCNLFHGDKIANTNDSQSKRDQVVIENSIRLLREILEQINST